MQKSAEILQFPEMYIRVNEGVNYISTSSYSIKEMQADPLLFIRAIYSSDIHPWQEDVVAEMVRYISEPVRSTTDVWNDMRNLPMTGTCKYREELIAELRGDVKRKWWQFWRKS